MNEKPEAPHPDAAWCSWCKIPLGVHNLVRQKVCLRCYELLKTANLTNEEIFSDDKRERLNFTLRLTEKDKE